MKELAESRADGGAWLADVRPSDWEVVSTQCAITVDHVHSLMASLRLSIDHQLMFVASDHQNLALEKALQLKGAVMQEKGDGLRALTVDFFLLQEAEYFTGNQLSSVTQNVCFMRLGRGRGCHGFIPSFSRYHSRPVM
jgi:hypothetical protein